MRSMCGVKLGDKKKMEDLMDMLGFERQRRIEWSKMVWTCD